MMPLSRIRVLDLSRILAAPFAAQMLADLGADVIKIERPVTGDDARTFGPPFLKDRDGNDTREGSFYLAANRNKRSVTVDISKPEGQAIIRELVKTCDVLLENYKVGTLARYGLDYESLRQVNPRIIYCSVTGFGQTGPYAHKAGYDGVFQAMSGLMSLTGHPDGSPGDGPQKVGPSIADIIAGIHAAYAMIVALYHRDANDGPGQYIDLSMIDTNIAMLSHHAQFYLMSGLMPKRMGTGGNGGVPAQMFQCADRPIMIVVGNDMQFNRFAPLIGRPDLLEDPRFTENKLRVRNRYELVPILAEVFKQKPVAEWIELLDSHDIPCSPVNDLAQMFEDPQIKHRELVKHVDHRLGGDLKILGSPLRFSETPITKYVSPPVMGQHTQEVLTSVLGYDDEKIRCLKASRVI